MRQHEVCFIVRQLHVTRLNFSHGAFNMPVANMHDVRPVDQGALSMNGSVGSTS
jgi:pyruvate kinase